VACLDAGSGLCGWRPEDDAVWQWRGHDVLSGRSGVRARVHARQFDRQPDGVLQGLPGAVRVERRLLQRRLQFVQGEPVRVQDRRRLPAFGADLQRRVLQYLST